MISRKTKAIAQNGIDKFEPFVVGNVSAIRTSDPSSIEWGRMPETEKKLFLDVINTQEAYLVYSYNTPIAVGIPETGEWLITGQTYSASTARQISQIRMMVDNPGFYSNR
jgi:hypothetical protein